MKTLRIALVLTAAAALSFPACTADEYGIVIRGLTNPDETCVWTVATGTDVFRVIGRIDLSFPGARYLAGVQIYNNLVESTPNTSMMSISFVGPMHLDANSVVPRRAYARLRGPDETNTGAAFGEYEWAVEMTGDTIPSAGSASSPTAGLVLFELIPNYVIANLISLDGAAPILADDPPSRAMLDFYIEFSTLSGDTVYSSTFTYAMEICYGCLNGYPGKNVEAGCEEADEGTGATCTASGNLCSPGQDTPTFCDCTGT